MTFLSAFFQTFGEEKCNLKKKTQTIMGCHIFGVQTHLLSADCRLGLLECILSVSAQLGCNKPKTFTSSFQISLNEVHAQGHKQNVLTTRFSNNPNSSGPPVRKHC